MGRPRHKPKRGPKKPRSTPTSEPLDPAEIPHNPETRLAMMVKHAASDKQPDLLSDFIELQKCRGEFQVDERDSRGITALHFACQYGKLELATILIKSGADANVRDDLGFTPLFYVTGRYPDPEITTYLLEEASALVNIVSNTGASALHGCALQGNIACMKLLLKHGADPRCEAEGGITPMDLAKDDSVRAVMHNYLRKEDSKAEKQMSQCEWCCCSAEEVANLKRCGNCRVALYCTRECQVKHWKEGNHKLNCPGFILVDPEVSGLPFKFMVNLQKADRGIATAYSPDDLTKPIASYVKKKDFIVKIQVPLVSGPGMPAMLGVYNEDRTVNGFIPPDARGYASLRRYIEVSGYKGVKAFFWAQFNDDNQGKFKVFHGKAAPFQEW